MTVSGYDSSSIGTLFSSLGSSATSGVGGLSSVLSDYISINNGSYGKLLKSYYNMDSSKDVKTAASDAVKERSSNDKTKASQTQREAYRMASDAAELSDATSAMMDKKMYELKETKDKDGKTTKEYDVDKIVEGTKEFISSFNSMIEDGVDSDISGVAKNAELLKTDAKLNKSALSAIGISVKDNGTLKLDEDKFRAADMSKIEDVFRGSGSFGRKVSQDVSMIESSAKAAQATGYNSSGSYSSTSGYSNFSSYI